MGRLVFVIGIILTIVRLLPQLACLVNLTATPFSALPLVLVLESIALMNQQATPHPMPLVGLPRSQAHHHHLRWPKLALHHLL